VRAVLAAAPILTRDTILTIAFDTDSTTLSYMNATERRIRESGLFLDESSWQKICQNSLTFKDVRDERQSLRLAKRYNYRCEMPMVRVAIAPTLNWPNISPPVIATSVRSLIGKPLILMATESIVMTETVYVG
jgi:hypothetical protein